MAGRRTIVAVVGAAAAALILSVTPVWEGKRNVGYLDIAGVPTKCFGDTRDVVVGHRYSDDECRASLDRALVEHAQPVVDCLPEIVGNLPAHVRMLATGADRDGARGGVHDAP
ncbi:glycoside hydrolase family protein [Nitratidesulfovibrio sp. 1201_IL3209]|uniref:glycoside hydrolase family protein n=1 Tax=Nitratidesulfovibrio sp. 1201_IL3209 TaxID=3084053 RepID=UPI002FDA9237